MISPSNRPPDSPHRWRRAAEKPRPRRYGAALAAALGGALIALGLHGTKEPAPAAFTEPARPQPSLHALTAGSPPLPMPAQPTVAASHPGAVQSIPAGDGTSAPGSSWSLAELQELQRVWANSADPTDEFTRLTEQALLADATQRLRELQSGGSRDAAEVLALADVIGPVLDAQLRRGQLARAEAVELKRQLLLVQYPQPAMQQAELARWLASKPGPP